MEQATSTYVDRLNELNELLLKIGAVSERLSIDSQEMENGGVKVYFQPLPGDAAVTLADVAKKF